MRSIDKLKVGDIIVSDSVAGKIYEIVSRYFNNASRTRSLCQSDRDSLISDTVVLVCTHVSTHGVKIETLPNLCYSIAKKSATDFFKKRRPQQTELKDFILVNTWFNDFDTEEIEAYKQASTDLLNVALPMIDSLPGNRGKALSFHVDNISNETIAEDLGITTGNVRVLLSRAKDDMKKRCENNPYYKAYYHGGEFPDLPIAV